MTVQVTAGAVPAPEKRDIPAKSPYVYTPGDTMNEQQVRQFRAPRRKAGFGAVPAAQLLISAGLGAAIWAAVNFGDEGTRELCERLAEIFR